MYRPDYKTNLVIVLYEMSLLGVLKFYIHKIDSSLRLLLLKSPMDVPRLRLLLQKSSMDVASL